ncbi:MAG: universal stress protein, partial [Chloroflexota bacterium]
MIKSILLAVDGSEHALKAAATAGDLARCLGARLSLVTVYDPLPPYLQEPGLQQAMDERFLQAEQVLHQALQYIGSTPEPVDCRQLEGPVAEAVLHAVQAQPVDLIVMGARGLGRLQGM